MPMYAYRFFSGTCREAFTWYHEIFGGQLDVMTMADLPEGEDSPPGASPDLVIHAALTLGDGGLFMASDDPTGDAGAVLGLCVNYSTASVDDAKRVFAALSEGGEVTMAAEETFWSPYFGACNDRFGTPWMVNAEPPAAT